MSFWHLFIPERQRRGPPDPAKGEVTCPACGRVRHISDMSHTAAQRQRVLNLIGNCTTCGGRNSNLGIAKSLGR